MTFTDIIIEIFLYIICIIIALAIIFAGWFLVWKCFLKRFKFFQELVEIDEEKYKKEHLFEKAFQHNRPIDEILESNSLVNSSEESSGEPREAREFETAAEHQLSSTGKTRKENEETKEEEPEQDQDQEIDIKEQDTNDLIDLDLDSEISSESDLDDKENTEPDLIRFDNHSDEDNEVSEETYFKSSKNRRPSLTELESSIRLRKR